MAPRGQRKKGRSFVTYIPPILFCGLLIVLALVRGRQAEQPLKAVLQESEPLTLTEQAVENYLYAAGFVWTEGTVLDEEGQPIAALAAQSGGDGSVESLTLSFSLPTYYETGADSEALAPLKAKHDAAAQRGEEMFLSIFDAIAATDARVAARRDSASEKYRKALDTGKAAAQAANSWRFSFSPEPGQIEGRVTILFEKAK